MWESTQRRTNAEYQQRYCVPEKDTPLDAEHAIEHDAQMTERVASGRLCQRGRKPLIPPSAPTA